MRRRSGAGRRSEEVPPTARGIGAAEAIKAHPAVIFKQKEQPRGFWEAHFAGCAELDKLFLNSALPLLPVVSIGRYIAALGIANSPSRPARRPVGEAHSSGLGRHALQGHDEGDGAQGRQEGHDYRAVE